MAFEQAEFGLLRGLFSAFEIGWQGKKTDEHLNNPTQNGHGDDRGAIQAINPKKGHIGPFLDTDIVDADGHGGDQTDQENN